MQLFSTLVFVGVASAFLLAEQSLPLMEGRGLGELVERQGGCGEGTSCETACGPEWRICARNPYCYDPNVHICCSTGWHCAKGTYCATGNHCCKNGQSLEECGATATLGTIPLETATKQPSESTSRQQAPTAPASSVTAATSLPPVVTAGARKNAEAGALAAVGGLAALLLAV